LCIDFFLSGAVERLQWTATVEVDVRVAYKVMIVAFYK
jgi:hypothetical protein